MQGEEILKCKRCSGLGKVYNREEYDRLWEENKDKFDPNDPDYKMMMSVLVQELMQEPEIDCPNCKGKGELPAQK